LCRSSRFNSFSNLCFDLRIIQVPQHCQSTRHSQRSNVKLSNYVIAKRVGLVVKRKEETLNEEAMTVADERRTISVAVTRKKKTAVDAIRNVAEGKFG
jgi:hypothetical protein